MAMAVLSVRGARQHNLRDISCAIPRDRLVVFSGPSGSGKSSLAFDTIYAEAHRLYLDSLPAAARRGLDHLPRPDVDDISGLSPAIALKQTTSPRHSRSTVGTTSEIGDYLRVLFARGAQAHCPIGGEPLRAYSAQQIVDIIEQQPAGTRLTLLAPLLRQATPPALSETLGRLQAAGYVRVRHNGEVVLLEELLAQSITSGDHDLDLVVDRLVLRQGLRARIADSVELALREGHGSLSVDVMDGTPPRTYSETLHCGVHGATLPAPDPGLFSFNTKLGACPGCSGSGVQRELSPERLVPNPRLTLRQGALAPFGRPGSLAYATLVDELVQGLGADSDVPWELLTASTQREIIFGRLPPPPAEGVTKSSKRRASARSRGYAGVQQVVTELLDHDTVEEPLDGALSDAELLSFFRIVPCRKCDGTRLTKAAECFRLAGLTFSEWSALPLTALREQLRDIERHASAPDWDLLGPLLHAIESRIRALLELGLGYVALATPITHLSSGEARRLVLGTRLGAPLLGVLYVLDEPSTGLHPADVEVVLSSLRDVVSRGNSVIMVEHQRSLISGADWVLDMGPGAGTQGGRVVAQGTVAELSSQETSVTAPFLDGRKRLVRSAAPAPAPRAWLHLKAALGGNLKGVDVSFPKQHLTVVTGVSGAGKTSLVMNTLLPALRAVMRGSSPPNELCAGLEGVVDFTRVVALDQAPIGRSGRSTPATYTGVMNLLRELFAALPESRARGFQPSRFSFNVKGGRCETCKGEGVQRLELQLLADVTVACSDCNGARFNRETLEPRFKGFSIADVLGLTVDKASAILATVPRIQSRLLSLQRLGLGYLELGQAAPSLSGGEAQRVRLATELGRQTSGDTLYLLDEATNGLHFQDVQILCDALFALRDEGHTLILIEHNMDVVNLADWVVDLGPGPSDAGGRVLYAGSPPGLLGLDTPTARALSQLPCNTSTA